MKYGHVLSRMFLGAVSFCVIKINFILTLNYLKYIEYTRRITVSMINNINSFKFKIQNRTKFKFYPRLKILKYMYMSVWQYYQLFNSSGTWSRQSLPLLCFVPHRRALRRFPECIFIQQYLQLSNVSCTILFLIYC